jgi:hypothetical protein
MLNNAEIFENQKFGLKSKNEGHFEISKNQEKFLDLSILSSDSVPLSRKRKTVGQG